MVLYDHIRMPLMEEIWKTAQGTYEVSNLGRLRNAKTYKILKQHDDKDGYLYYGSLRINRLVALAFIPNPENKPTVNHIDGDKHNNNITNLEWATLTEQQQHAYKLGLKKPMNGVNHPSHKLSKEDVIWIRKHYKAHDKEYGMIPLSKKFGVSEVTIKRVAKQYNQYYRDLD